MARRGASQGACTWWRCHTADRTSTAAAPATESAPGKGRKASGGARIAQRHSCRDARSSTRLRLRSAAGSASSGPSSSRVFTRSAKPLGSRKRSASSRARCAAISTVAASHAAAAAPPRAEPLPRAVAATCGTDCAPRESVPARPVARTHRVRSPAARTVAQCSRLARAPGSGRTACQCVARGSHGWNACDAPRSGCSPAPQTPPPAQPARRLPAALLSSARAA